jgi:hypothetical protein
VVVCCVACLMECHELRCMSSFKYVSVQSKQHVLVLHGHACHT